MSDEHKSYMDKLSKEYLEGLGYDSTGPESAEKRENLGKPAGAARAGSANTETVPASDGKAEAGLTDGRSASESAGTSDASASKQYPIRVKPGLGTLIRHLLRRLFLRRR